MVWRDAAADSGRLGSSDSPVRKDKLTVSTDWLEPDTLGSQADQGGWNNLDKPVGGPPPSARVSGTRN